MINPQIIIIRVRLLIFRHSGYFTLRNRTEYVSEKSRHFRGLPKGGRQLPLNITISPIFRLGAPSTTGLRQPRARPRAHFYDIPLLDAIRAGGRA